jgi:tetratricopeptide (TPR) repeat protein
LPTYVMMLGDLYRASGKHALAAREYRLVLAEQKLFQANGVVPDTEIMVFNADHGLKLHETLKQARAQYRIRSSVRVADALSWVLYANRDYTEAAKYSRRALRLGTKDPTYYFHAGMIAKAVGDAARARCYLTFAVRTNPHFSIRYAPEAVAALKDLATSQQGPR